MKKTFLIAAIFAVYGLLGTPVAHADTLGQDVTFNTNPTFDAGGASAIGATLRAVGTDAYFYVDDREWAALSSYEQNSLMTQLSALATQFDSVIWPTETAFWGMPNTPGVDNDPRITVLLERLTSGSGGYFDTVNGYPKSRAPESNAREMVVVSADSIIPGTAKSFLAHEFQHLISFNQKELTLNVSDDTWLNEARSEYSITLDGYDQPFDGSTFQRRVLTFQRTPSDSLTGWSNMSTDYGIASVFIHYLADRFGPVLLQSTIHDRSAGAAAIQDWLTSNQPGTTFGGVFADWMADALTNPLIRLTPPQSMTYSPTSTLTWSPVATEWQPEWLSVQFNGTVSDDITLSANTAGPNPWFADIVLNYGASQHILRWSSADGSTITLPALDGSSPLQSVVLAFAQGSTVPADNRQLASQQAVITLSGATTATSYAAAMPTPVPAQPTGIPNNGDLIRRAGQADVYVVWGPYRRYMTPGTLALYGFQDRPVITVSDDMFFRYLSTNYIRAVDQQKVYAVWPDGTKHWLNITPAQWDASHRDWNAVFIVNDAEANSYTTGVDITR
ncbi:MAG TPA: hypothetical protein VMU12_03025 [Candidatus Paceibacterota bacterium]|nr:hypothetical protein [Candidatus Paceibacterota bacterium]